MKCPNCSRVYTAGNSCPHCGMDMVIYLSSIRTSNSLYNQGLGKLRVNDLYHGIKLLNKSIAINKDNIAARNLLGLALFEIGHVGDALKHWIISSSIIKKDNAAVKYIDKIHKNENLLEKYSDAVLMFNQALEHIKQKSDDLAVIQLKKAIETNPKFIDAINLLTLCYLIQNNKEKAVQCVEQVLSIDSLNPITLNYYNILNPSKNVSKKIIREPQQKLSMDSAPFKAIGIEEKKKSFHLAEIASLFIGAAITLGFVYFLFLPSIENQHETNVNEIRNEMNQMRNEMQVEIDDLDLNVTGLENNMTNLTNENTNLRDNLELRNRELSVHHAFNAFTEGDMHRAVNMIYDISTDNLQIDVIDRIITIRLTAYPIIGTEYYNEGLQAFNAEDSFLALASLENAKRFLNEESLQWNELLFMLATLYYNQTDRIQDAYDLLISLQESSPEFRVSAIEEMLLSIESQR